MSSAPSFLQHLGSILMKILHIGEQAAIVAAPVVQLAFPEVAPLYTSAIGLAIAAETTAAGASGTGTQKLASVVAGLTPLAEQFAAQNNLTLDNTKVNAWASAVADSLNLLPFAPKTAA
jgi:hypothetical protein